MIVCVCNNISEGKIHQAVSAGMTSMSELRKELGVGTSCGKCHTCAKHVLRECLGKSNKIHHSVQPIVFHANTMAA
jgi:bacterioferritin-associated ferredoxin